MYILFYIVVDVVFVVSECVESEKVVLISCDDRVIVIDFFF